MGDTLLLAEAWAYVDTHPGIYPSELARVFGRHDPVSLLTAMENKGYLLYEDEIEGVTHLYTFVEG